MEKMHYGRLMTMAVSSFLAMYALMYAMVNTFSNVYSNLNQCYMAGLMAAPMVIIELALMGAMYGDRRRNALVMAGSLVAMLVFWVCIRQQARHHGQAVPPLHDPAPRGGRY
jgi:hypothetical protein